MRVKVNNYDISYDFEIVDDRPTVVFVHGFPFNRKMWGAQVDFLRGKYSVLTYDVRGHGESEVGDGQYMFENFVDDFIELMKVLKLEGVVACGLSMGGYIILRAYEKQPALFRSLILCDTRAEADGNEAKLRRAYLLHLLKYHGKEKFAEEFIKNVLCEKTMKEKDDVVRYVLDMILENDERGIAGALIALATRTDTTAVLEKIDIPVLLIVGENDSLTSPAVMQSMNAKIKNSRLVIIPNAGHLSNVENSERFNEELEKFLNELFEAS